VWEVAKAWECSEQHIINLIDRGELHATNIGSAKVRSKRSYFRIPVSEYDRFVVARSNV
jgi:hypothetical protein